MNGKLQQKSISKVSLTNYALVIEILIPIVLGIIAIVAHARYRSGMNLPGHHGLEFMALLLIAQSTGKTKWSAYLFSLGVAAFAFVPFLGFKNPFVAMIYVVPGIILGIVGTLSSIKKYKILFYAIIGGFAYASIPIIRFISGIASGVMHKSLITGAGYPILSFFMFGLIGSLFGMGVYNLKKRILK